MAKEADSGKGIGLAILGIVAVIAIVGLVLLFSGAKMTGKAGVEQSYASALGGKAINTFRCPETCQVRGMRGSVTCTVDAPFAGKPTTLESDECPGKLPAGAQLKGACTCVPERHAWT